jgi:hypothetical protein
MGFAIPINGLVKTLKREGEIVESGVEREGKVVECGVTTWMPG